MKAPAYPDLTGRHGLLVALLDGVRDADGVPMHARIYQHVRDAVLRGALPPGYRLPSSRTLADDLAVSRNTIEAAIGQLAAEGFLIRHDGRGTTVSPALPAEPRSGRRPRAAAPRQPPAPWTDAALSSRGRDTLAANHLIASVTGYTFAPCIPDADALPSSAWRSVLARRSRQWSGPDTAPPDRAGWRPLREAIAAYVVSSRGVRCDWRQVLVVASVQQGLGLIARMLLERGDAIWLEEPAYPGARAAFAAAGAHLVPVPVDDRGLDVAAGERLGPHARLAYVTPSHQYPLGVTLSLERRLALLDWARRRGAWIVEDDYDSEIRYVGRPLASIQGLDDAGRVIYAGTFGKVLFPSVRLAYLVLPQGLVDPLATAHEVAGGVVGTFVQSAVADFMESGRFPGHLRRLRELFAERRNALLDAAATEWPGLVRLGPADTGLHVTGHIDGTLDDRAISALAAGHRLDLPPLSGYYSTSTPARGLLVHYAGTPVPRIREGVAALARVLRDAGRAGRPAGRTSR